MSNDCEIWKVKKLYFSLRRLRKHNFPNNVTIPQLPLDNENECEVLKNSSSTTSKAKLFGKLISRDYNYTARVFLDENHEISLRAYVCIYVDALHFVFLCGNPLYSRKIYENFLRSRNLKYPTK